MAAQRLSGGRLLDGCDHTCAFSDRRHPIGTGQTNCGKDAVSGNNRPELPIGQVNLAHTTSSRLALLCVVAYAAWLRLLPISWGLPIEAEPDTFVAEHVMSVREGRQGFDDNLAIAQYPHLLAKFTLMLPDQERDPARLAAMSQAEHKRNASLPYLEVRIVVALLSLLAVPAAYWISRYFVPSGWAMFAAALTAGSLLLVNLGQQGRPHAAFTGLLSLTIAAALRLGRNPTTSNFFLAGAGAMASVGCLPSGIFALLPVAVAFVVSRNSGRRWLDPRAVIPLLLAASAYPLFYKGMHDPKVAQARAAGLIEPLKVEQNLEYWVREVLSQLDPRGFVRVGSLLFSWEPVLLAMLVLSFLAGIVYLVRGGIRIWSDRHASFLVAGAFGIPYLSLMLAFSKTYERFLTPLVPLLACTAAGFLFACHQKLKSGQKLFRVLCAIILVMSSAAGVKLAWLRTRPGTLGLATEFLAHNMQPTDRVFLSPPLDIDVARTKESMVVDEYRQTGMFSPWGTYQSSLPDGQVPHGPRYYVEWMTARAGDFNLDDDRQLADYIDSFGPGWYVTDLERERKRHWYGRIRKRLDQVGLRKARISPDPDPMATDIGLNAQDRPYHDNPNATWRIIRARAYGPVLEIYRVLGS